MKMVRYDDDATLIVEDGKVIANILTLTNGLYSLVDADDRKISNRTYETKKDAFEAYKEIVSKAV